MVSSQFSRLLAAEIDGRTQNTRYRQNEFHRLQSALSQHIDEIQDAIQKDSGNEPEEVRAELCLALKEIRTHYQTLSLEKDLEEEYRVVAGKDNADAKRGAGIVYIVPSTHTMFYSVVSALSAALAAGNCIILELMKTTMVLPAVLRRILSQALDADTFAISEERPDAAFLSRVFMVSQTGSAPLAERSLLSPSNARTVAIVDRTADVAAAAEALVAARFAFGGRSTYSPDIVLVNEFAMKRFVEAAIQQASRYLAGPNGETRQGASNPRRFGPSASLLDAAHKDAGARVLVSGSGWGVVEDHDRNSPLLTKKVQEKVLILHPVTSLDDAIDVSNSRGTLAATYAFGSPSAAKYITQFIDASISWINHVPFDMLSKSASPFHCIQLTDSVGPAYPINTGPSTATRYTPALFQVPRPQFVAETNNSALVKCILDPSDATKSGNAWREALAALPSTGQRPGWRIGFFEQGIITGGVITLATLVAAVSTVGWYTFSYVRRLRA
ncbi:aldehyde dehydrogenase family 3 member B1 [Aspergillus udagawae]|uniref:Aldehyde dehydrogenase family 3 member B1 n=1 Tax=Aspergillus udagawae TaxID=91492 RepID=A0A8H3XRZ3_9EURO|nr:aldehyde dehydrogenase family 3 member B1 [Aspergillus udagawae]